jgi:hypothetical protein
VGRESAAEGVVRAQRDRAHRPRPPPAPLGPRESHERIAAQDAGDRDDRQAMRGQAVFPISSRSVRRASDEIVVCRDRPRHQRACRAENSSSHSRRASRTVTPARRKNAARRGVAARVSSSRTPRAAAHAAQRHDRVSSSC